MRTFGKILLYDHRLIERAREMRNNPTKSESVLWQHLKGKQVLGIDFHRQKPIAHFIVDFYAPSVLLIIEVDGDVHKSQKEEDEARQKILESLGLNILRFTDKEVLEETGEVIRTITKWIKEHYPEKCKV